jgi:hypothetical protein
MGKKFLCFLLLIVVGVSGNVLLEKIKDNSITCDYLIVCPKEMGQPAISLAEHRNAFAYDEVTNAHVAYLEDIVIEFNGTDYKKRNETLWYAIKWASENWKGTLKFLVLIGYDNYKIDPLDSTAHSLGIMPTWYSDRRLIDEKPDLYLTVSDDFYSSINLDKPQVSTDAFYTYPLYIGRIPALSTTLCSIYVEKVKKYDLNRRNGIWKNNVIAIADDSYQGGIKDLLSTFFQTACNKIVPLCNGFFINKQYISSFPTDQFYTKPEATISVFNSFNKGAGITFFYGHGNESVLTDEEVLDYTDFDRFENDTMPTAFFSFTSKNGTFLSNWGNTMWSRFLFKESGGCIAYFSSAASTIAVSNELLGMSVFKELNGSRQNSLGQIIFEAKKKSQHEVYFGSYFLLGDPALKLFSNNVPVVLSSSSDTLSPKTINLSVNGAESKSVKFNYCLQFSFEDTVKPMMPEDFEYVKDSVFFVKTGTFENAINIELPSHDKSSIKAVAYIWNDSTEGRSQIKINKVTTSVVNLRKMILSKGAVDVTVNNSILTISTIQSSQKAGTLKVFDLKGRLLITMKFNTNQHRIDLKSRLSSSGRYLLLLNIGDIKLQKSIMVFK